MFYNVKVIDYLEGQQIRVYSRPIENNNIDLNSIALDEDLANVQQPIDDNNNNNNICLTDSIDSENVLIDDSAGVKDLERSIASSTSRTINSIYQLTRSNYWEYFLTLTFNPDKVNSFDYDEVSKKLSKWINHFKERYAPDLKYILVPELHKSGRIHFHGLLANIGNAQLIDSGKTDNKGNVIYNLGNYKLGFTTCTKINDVARASSYITKYVTKELCTITKNKKRYWCSKNLDKPTETLLLMDNKEINDMILTFNDRIGYKKEVEVDTLAFQFKTTYFEVDYRKEN